MGHHAVVAGGKDGEVHLIGTGLLMGLVHVLSGPDHLSALATLSVGNSWKAFYLGIRWGLGHSTGLVLIAAIFLAFDGDFDLSKVAYYCDWIVGLFMIALGLYGVVKAQHTREAHKLHEWGDEHGSTGAEDGTLRSRDSMQAMDWGPVSTPTSIDSAASHSHSHRHERLRTVESPPASSSSASVVEMAQRAPSGGKKDKHKQQSPGAVAVVVEGQRAGKEEDDERSQVTLRGAGDASVSSQGSGASGTQWLCKGSSCASSCGSRVDLENAATQRLVAFGVGIVHGIAGPGGILGVLPAVQLHDWGKASVYLGTFCITSTLVMGVFASLYGEVTARVASSSTSKVEYGLGVFSALLSVLVGVGWIALLCTGKLQAFFG